MSDERHEPDEQPEAKAQPEADEQPETDVQPEADEQPETDVQPEADEQAETEGAEVAESGKPSEAEKSGGSDKAGASEPSVAIVVLPEGRSGGDVARMALIGMLIVTLVALVGVAVLGSRSLAVRSEAESRREATRTAEEAASAILAYDYRHLDRDLKRANGFITGKFAKEYEKTSRNVLRKTAPDVEAVVKAEVMASSVVRASPDEVVCLLFVNQTTQSNVRSQSVPDRNRVRMTMTKVDDSWKVSDLDAL